jgi:hypothetical protein
MPDLAEKKHLWRLQQNLCLRHSGFELPKRKADVVIGCVSHIIAT